MSSSLANLTIDLNPQQREAVRHHEGPILILAGAGSGKTRVLTNRVANLVLEYGEDPENIIAVTFTNKATQEMRERILQLLGSNGAKVWIATFHSACLRMLRAHPQAIGFTPNFVIYDDDDCQKIVEAVLEDEGLDKKRHYPKGFLKAFDRYKNYLITPDEAARDADSFDERLKAQIYGSYQQKLREANAMDFGDLLMYAVQMLENNKEILKYYQRRLKFMLVDEFQDTNIAQYRWVKLLTNAHHNLLVVGDDDQSIYAFRGATIRNILDFEKDYPEAKVIKLEQNYRSTQNVLTVSHAIISKNKDRKDKKLWTDRSEGERIILSRAENESEEAEFIATEIAKRANKSGDYEDIAVFYRTNAQSRAIEEALMKSGIPYRIYGGMKFYDRKEIKDILAYLRLLTNPQDNQAFIRAISSPARGVGEKTIQQLKQRGKSLLEAARSSVTRSKGLKDFLSLIDEANKLKGEKTIDSLIDLIITKSNYLTKLHTGSDPYAESRAENIRELQAIAKVHGNDLQAFLDKVSLTSGLELPEDERIGEKNGRSGAVSLMTLHLAKGLEFRTVFLSGFEEGLIPHYRSIEDGGGAIEEERRLLYVGITRAMEVLYITRSTFRGMFARTSGTYRLASRFIADLPLEVCEEWANDELHGGFVREYHFDEAEEVVVKKQKQKPDFDIDALIKTADELTPFVAPAELHSGIRVTHPIFGEGTVVEIEGDKEDPQTIKVSVRFDKQAKRVKRLSYQYAKLELLN